MVTAFSRIWEKAMKQLNIFVCYGIDSLFQPLTIRKSITYLFTHFQVIVIERVEYNGRHFGYIHFTVFVENALIYAYVYYFTSQNTGLWVIVLQFTFQHYRQFVNQRCIHKLRTSSMKPARANLSETLLPETIPT